MNTRDPKLTALLFNECINAQDIQKLVALMADNISMISHDKPDNKGKESCGKAWLSFWRGFPDYRNHFNRIESRDNFVIIMGKNTCSKNADFLNKNNLWSAVIENDKVSEWQIYDDTLENRNRLEIV